MPNAPAGWYDYPGAPGSTRYWTGTAWLAPGVGPAVAAPGFAPQPTGFAPQPTGFAPQPTGFAPQPTGFAPQPTGLAPQPEFRPAPAVTGSHEQVRPVANQYLQPQATEPVPAAQEEAVTWDVVGIPRTSDDTGVGRAQQAPWQGSATQGYGRAGDPGAYAPSLYGSHPPLPPYGSSTFGRKRRSGWTKVAAVVTLAVIGFGVRWGLVQFFGNDYSDDGRIEVATPDNWATYSIQNPDITYAMNSGWADYTSAAGSDISGKGVRVVTVRSLATDFSGKQALLVMGTTTFSAPGVKASREDFAAALDKALGSVSELGGEEATLEKLKILKSDAGDRWGIQSATFPIADTTMTDYLAVTIIDGYAVVIQLFVPEGVGLTEADILAVVNSVRGT